MRWRGRACAWAAAIVGFGAAADSSYATVTATPLPQFAVVVGGAAGHGALVGGPDGNLYVPVTSRVVGPNASPFAIARIAPGGQVLRTFPIGNRPVANAMIFGPDGALWPNVAGPPSFLARLSLDGAFTTVASDPDPGPIVSGPDGAVWFARTASQVTRVTTSGQVTGNWGPAQGITRCCSDLTVGPDRNVWAGTTLGLARLDPNGRGVRFHVGLGLHSQPFALETGSDGRLWWLSGNGRDRRQVVGRLDVRTGAMQEFCGLAVTRSTALARLARAPDGSMWSIDQTGARLAHITPDGVVREVRVPATNVFGLAVTADGSAWTIGASTSQYSLIRVTADTPGTVACRPPSRPIVRIAGTRSASAGRLRVAVTATRAGRAVATLRLPGTDPFGTPDGTSVRTPVRRGARTQVTVRLTARARAAIARRGSVKARVVVTLDDSLDYVSSATTTVRMTR